MNENIKINIINLKILIFNLVITMNKLKYKNNTLSIMLFNIYLIYLLILNFIQF